MSSPRKVWKKDFQDLLQTNAVADAQWKALAQLDVALSSLNATDRALLEGHFDGRSTAELATAHGMSETEAKDSVTRVKKDLIEALKSRILVRH